MTLTRTITQYILHICWSVKETARQWLLGMRNDFCEVGGQSLTKLKKNTLNKVHENAVAVLVMQNIKEFLKNWKTLILCVKNTYTLLSCFLLSLQFLSPQEKNYSRKPKNSNVQLLRSINSHFLSSTVGTTGTLWPLRPSQLLNII